MTTWSLVAPLPRPGRWHRPLLIFAVAMVVLAVAATAAAVVDPREVTGAGAWLKPLKFAISGAFYTLTLAWIIGQVQRGRRIADRAGTWVAISLSVEIVLIFILAGLGQSSHFNITTPLHTAVWAVMAASITLVWIMTLLIAAAVIRDPGPDPARTLAARTAVILALIGLALGFLMTLPTPGQLDDFEGIVGAHAVGIPDGGPGLPLVGWSTVGGDLRIPHFIGMHALQVIPLALLALELLARCIPPLADPRIRLEVLTVVIITFSATLVTVTVQALLGQSIVQPSGGVLVAGIAIALGAGTAITIILFRKRTRRPDVAPVDSR
ncbi:hypothetical protein [Microbacterium caowuchunii]|uniref:Uncharacterized protein n=1 Tax=Microbacterium caowuchunii TaxID=2614638 RepID=A0A5N0TLD7_9MICO|nr:hypothetical protein [Microbacterium caowuchunii]KAA9135973.1 hypothetical protein F6B40_02005 [Microbacterium caowuchunii]